MKLSELLEKQPTDENIQRLLFEGLDYRGENADLIMVLGSRKACDYRVPEAVRLYNEGKAPKLLFSGGQVQETSLGVMAEWESMEKTALALGVPEGDILTERRSGNTAENFRFSAELTAGYLSAGKSIILVTTAYHQRRAMCFAEKFMAGYEFIPCPVQKGSAAKENWYKTDKGRRTVLDEWRKLSYYIRVGLLEDIDI
ncbi:YdcF family protein [Ruminococcus sp.]|uniref:YdcF family protein n=1 Tax=Ruminococcus sp. TaxID=41978 RepID=UPI0025D85B7C|nr:YdcF family protein [Ruminococcus sp.]MBQ8965705.1 YdcF family protein [Ruminococcus sp.]